MRTAVLTIVLLVILMWLVYEYTTLTDNRVKVKAMDGREYLVLNTKDKHTTANALARLNANIIALIAYMDVQKNPKYAMAVQRLKLKYKPDVISEGLIDKTLTSFTINKGEQIVFCMRPRHGGSVYDDNLLMYVAMHELAHVMSITEQHTPEFKENFNFLIESAKALKLFQHNDNSTNYCGLDIPRI